ncbi:hypothetical protein ICM05_05380 [Leucobacter sp. cx-42]|uniref:hypothetical protein n=1 Tax=unclassified Leucobacter TaxID=2621730 RepID=UPI00165E1955|nr:MULTISPECIES: hypothetical protein [unclassified Leucobacter]MBC9954078.1 hypothetical protein [Leucobacter sp. cx-42]
MFTLTTALLTTALLTTTPIPVDTSPAWGYESVSDIDTSHYASVYAAFGGEVLSYTSSDAELPSLTVTKDFYEVRDPSGVTQRIELYDDGTLSTFAG